MRQKWEDYENTSGPIPLFFKVLFALVVCLVPSWFLLRSCASVNQVASVAQKEFGAKESLRKYEWFKDASAQLDAKRNTIGLYQAKLHTLEKAYPNLPRGQWARDDREQWSIWSSELAGVRASFNTLAAEYNAQSSKFNWAFAQGDIPQTIVPLETNAQ